MTQVHIGSPAAGAATTPAPAAVTPVAARRHPWLAPLAPVTQRDRKSVV